MLISVIVPIYKVEDYLPRCIESIMGQTYSHIEIILVDDGSPDRCPSLCDEYAKSDPRIKVIHKVNGGLSDARNAGLQVASGEYVMFVDADDYIELDVCEKLQTYASSEADILICDGISEGGNCALAHFDENVFEMTGEEYLYRALSCRKFPVVVWMNVYRKAFLQEQKLTFKKGMLHEDEDFTPRAFLTAKKVIHTAVFFYHYVIRVGSITQQADRRKNVDHIFSIMSDLQNLYRGYAYQERKLKKLLIDLTVRKYLFSYYDAQAWRYEKQYTHKLFCLKNSRSMSTFLQSVCFCLNPYLFCYIKMRLTNR